MKNLVLASCLVALTVAQYESGQSAFEALKVPHNLKHPSQSAPSAFGPLNNQPRGLSQFRSEPSPPSRYVNPAQFNSRQQNGAYEQPAKIVNQASFPRIGHNGVPLDSPDVAQAKAAHFEAHSKALNHLRYGRSVNYYGHHENHGHGHPYSTQNHYAHFGPHHEFHVDGHGHYRRKREAYHHGHAYSTQNHNAYFGHPHVVHVGGGHYGGENHHHVYRRDTTAGSTQNSNSFFGESKQVAVSGAYAPNHPGIGVPHETAEVQLAKQAHFLEHDKVLKQNLYRKPGTPSFYGYNQESRFQAETPSDPQEYY